MAKLTGALLSLGARGTIGKTIVFASARGVSYARQHVIPSNPQSTAQTLTRDCMAVASNIWKNAPAELIAPWNLFAQGRPASGRSLFIGSYVRTLRGAVPPETDRSLMVFSPGAKGGIAPAAVVATAGANQVSIAITAPALPTGWTITAVVGAVIGNVAPESFTFERVVAGSEAIDTDPVVITGLETAQEYVCAGWIEWLRPDGAVAYGASLNDLATPT